jgi:hypothetical protein
MILIVTDSEKTMGNDMKNTYIHESQYTLGLGFSREKRKKEEPYRDQSKEV